MLWEVEIVSDESYIDREGARIEREGAGLGCTTISRVDSARVFLLEGELSLEQVQQIARLVVDPVTEVGNISLLDGQASAAGETDRIEINVLFKPGMTDNVAYSTRRELQAQQLPVTEVATCRRYWFDADTSAEELNRSISRILANDAIERVVRGPLQMTSIAIGHETPFELKHVRLSGLNDEELMKISRENLLSLSLVEMQTIQAHFAALNREPTDIELESVAQTWSEHCSHKTLAGRIRYTDENGTRQFSNMLKETIFASTVAVRNRLGENDWCVSVFKDNAGIVTFNETYDACFKVETHNRPSALEPYGGANTGIGGVIRDCLGTGLGGRPVCNTDVFCFAPPDIKHSDLPPGVLHPKTVARGVVAGVRDYGNRMGIPTVNGAVFFDPRYIGNPLVYCGNVALIPRGKSEKLVSPGEYVVTIGGRTGLDGIHGATFSSAVLTENSEETSGGAVQIGNAITEKMVADAVLKARDLNLFSAITDCGAGGFSSAIGEMGEQTGAEVWLDRAPLKYAGLSYMEIWISEAQERMVLAVPPEKWDAFKQVCESEGVEATILGVFTDTRNLVLMFKDAVVGELTMEFLHDGRPPIIRDAVYTPKASQPANLPADNDLAGALNQILASPNVCSKEWIIRQYDHEVQATSVVKPLVGVGHDGPGDAAVIRPDLHSDRGLVIANGMNPRFADDDPWWMAISAVDEAIRNCVAVGADPDKIAVLDNFCWGNTDRPETLGALVRSALGCQEAALQFGTPFISGKDSLHNEFTYQKAGQTEVVSIPHSLLISAIGQMDQVDRAVTMDLKQSGNRIAIIGCTREELAGSHYQLVRGFQGGTQPIVDFETANKQNRALFGCISCRQIRACHDLSEGGLAVAAAEMAFSGNLGLDLQLDSLPVAGAGSTGLPTAVKLFSESNSRYLIEVEPGQSTEVEQVFAGLPFAWIGTVTETCRLVIADGTAEPVINEPVGTLKQSWQQTLNWD